MSRIIGPNRHNRGMKQSILFAQTHSEQPTSSYSMSSQQDIYNQFNTAISGTNNSSVEPTIRNSNTPQSRVPKRSHSRTVQQESFEPDLNTGTMRLPENFTTVSVDQDEINNIQTINTNASYRNMSATMYEDTMTVDSNYKHTMISNMAKDVLNTAAYLCKSSESESRTYENQVSNPMYDPSYGARQLNMISAQQIVNRSRRNKE